MNVRIGNDIRLNLTLKGPRNYDQANIKQLRAYLINTSMQDFDGPFEPCNCGNSGCRINACGKGGYFHNPSNFHHCCGGCCDYKYWLQPCKPFGPRHRGPFHPHLWWDKPVLQPGRVPFNVALVEGPLPPKYGPGCDCGCECGGPCHPWHKPCSHPHPGMGFGFCGDPAPTHINEDFRYLAPSRVLEEKNRIQVYFPACDQYACGVYKLVIVLVVYEAGWGRCDLHTYTIDYGDVLTLVDDNSGISGDITLDVDNNTMSNSDIVDINVKSASYYMYPNANLPLGKEDNRGNVYEIEVTLSNGATVKYTTDSDNWPYEDTLNFSSATPTVARIADSRGTIHSNNVAEGSRAIITVSSKKNPAISQQFTVFIEGSGQVVIDPININAPSQINLNVGQVKPLDISIEPADHTATVHYFMGDESIAVYENGKIRGVSEGTTRLTVIAGDIVKIIDVVVTAADVPVIKANSISIERITMFPVQMKNLDNLITVLPRNAEYTVSYSVLDNTIATVNGNMIRAQKVGTSTVIATTDNNKSGQNTVNVIFPYELDDVHVSYNNYTKINPIKKSGAPDYQVRYEVLDSAGNPSNIATVDNNGTLYGDQVGTGKLRMWIDDVNYIDVDLTVTSSLNMNMDVTPQTITVEWNEYQGAEGVDPVTVYVDTVGEWSVTLKED